MNLWVLTGLPVFFESASLMEKYDPKNREHGFKSSIQFLKYHLQITASTEPPIREFIQTKSIPFTIAI
jgi:hypothetical protein